MYRLRVRLLFQPVIGYSGTDLKRKRRVTGMPPCQRAGERDAGGFIDMNETGEEGVSREVEEETGLKVKKATYLFSLPNIYIYSGFPVHTLDMFFLCQVEDTSHFEAMDDVADSFFVLLCQINPEEFGLGSIKKGLKRFLKER